MHELDPVRSVSKQALRPVPSVTPAQLAASTEVFVVDLRSSKEFAEDHVPDALHVPLFDDVERAVIGTLYVKKSRAEAFKEGRRATRERIEGLVRSIAQLVGAAAPSQPLGVLVEQMTAGGIDTFERELSTQPVDALPNGALVLSCWRGGLRSRAVASLLARIGFAHVHVLEGGYKAYRSWVRERIAAFHPPPSFVLRGLTGVGKTLVLHEIEKRRPGTTLDLEGLAGHRSSILGRVGLDPCTQRTFDSRLAARLGKGFDHFCVVEGESRKVGDIILPASVWEAVDEGVAIELVAPTGRRVEVLAEDYLATDGHRAELAQWLPFIEERLGSRKWKGELVRMLDAGEDAELCELLLERYYDPLYLRSEAHRSYALTIDATDPGQAAEEVIASATRSLHVTCPSSFPP